MHKHCNTLCGRLLLRVSFETSFDSKQPKLEPKLVSALSETKRLFRLFRFYTETENFDVSIEPKQTGDQPKQFDREHILLFVTENVQFFRFFSIFFGFFRFFSVFFGFFRFFSFFSFFSFFRFVSKLFVSVVSLLYRNREFRLNRNKQKTHPNSLKESIFEYFSENLGLFRFFTKHFCLFVSRNKPKQTRNRSCFGLFRFEPKIIFVCFEDTYKYIHRSA